MKTNTLILLIAVSCTGVACTTVPTQSVYIAGVSKHLDSNHSSTNEGHMKYIGLSQDYERNEWLYENTVSTFVDSYNLRSYMLTSNISHKSWLYYGFLRPMIGVNCAYKGYSHDHGSRRWLCTPPLKLRVGRETGLFANIMATPKIGDITNGLVAAEVGYKYNW